MQDQLVVLSFFKLKKKLFKLLFLFKWSRYKIIGKNLKYKKIYKMHQLKNLIK